MWLYPENVPVSRLSFISKIKQLFCFQRITKKCTWNAKFQINWEGDFHLQPPPPPPLASGNDASSSVDSSGNIRGFDRIKIFDIFGCKKVAL